MASNLFIIALLLVIVFLKIKNMLLLNKLNDKNVKIKGWKAAVKRLKADYALQYEKVQNYPQNFKKLLISEINDELEHFSGRVKTVAEYDREKQLRYVKKYLEELL